MNRQIGRILENCKRDLGNSGCCEIRNGKTCVISSSNSKIVAGQQGEWVFRRGGKSRTRITHSDHAASTPLRIFDRDFFQRKNTYRQVCLVNYWVDVGKSFTQESFTQTVNAGRGSHWESLLLGRCWEFIHSRVIHSDCRCWEGGHIGSLYYWVDVGESFTQESFTQTLDAGTVVITLGVGSMSGGKKGSKSIFR